MAGTQLHTLCLPKAKSEANHEGSKDITSQQPDKGISLAQSEVSWVMSSSTEEFKQTVAK